MLATAGLAIAILAAGVGTASATLLCNSTSCTEPYGANTAIEASLKEGTEATLLSSAGPVTCKSASLAGKTTAEAGKPLPLKLSELSFGGCEREFLSKEGKEGCTVTTVSLPTAPSLEASEEGNGSLSLKGGEVNFHCGSFINCTYATPNLQATGGNPATLSVKEVSLAALSGLFCPTTGKLDVTYVLAKPTPAYLVAGGTLLCNSTSCTEPYGANTAIEASLKEGTEATLLSSAGPVTCKSASLAGKTTAEAGKPLPLKLSELSFGGCEREFLSKEGKEGCTVTTVSLPTAPSLEASEEGNGTFSLKGGEVNFHCGSFINCTYATPNLQATGGNPATLSVKEVSLTTLSGLFCPATGKLDVTYTVTKPAPAYLVE